MAGLIEELLKNKEDLLASLLTMLEGKEARAKIDLDGIVFTLGKSKVQVEGKVEFTFIPLENKKKK